MEWLADPSAWMGLLTLIVLELVLGIDNLVVIAILADKLPPHQRDKARLIGLSLALLMRLALLGAISWMVTLTRPLFELFGHPFSGRDLIMLLGGCSCSPRRRWSARPPEAAATNAIAAPACMPVSARCWCRSWCWMRCSR